MIVSIVSEHGIVRIKVIDVLDVATGICGLEVVVFWRKSILKEK